MTEVLVRVSKNGVPSTAEVEYSGKREIPTDKARAFVGKYADMVTSVWPSGRDHVAYRLVITETRTN